MVKDTRLSTKLWAAANWTLIGFFIVNLFGMIAAVVTSSFSTRWLRSWLPDGWTLALKRTSTKLLRQCYIGPHMCIYIYMCVFVCVYICVYIYVYMYMHIYIYIYLFIFI